MNAISILSQISDALVTQADAAQPLVVAIRNPSRQHISGILWEPDVVITSEQSMGERDEYEVVGCGDSSGDNSGARVQVAKIVGRDPATNLIALRLDKPIDATGASTAATAVPRPGALVLAVAADADGKAAVRLGSVHAMGPEWRSRLGGRIDMRISLDIRLGRTEEGGPVLDTNGALLGMSTQGYAGQVLVIPIGTLSRVVPQLLREGRVARGRLGLGLQAVAVPAPLRDTAEQSSGMIVMSIAEDGPAAKAGVRPGDILLSIDGSPIQRARQLASVLDADSIGKIVELRLIHGGDVISLKVTIDSQPKP